MCEKLEIQITALYTDEVTNVKIIYTHKNINDENSMAGNFVQNYALIVLSAFIMENREYNSVDNIFNYYMDRFTITGTYYEGNAWLSSKDEKGVFVIEILPIGLLQTVDTFKGRNQ